MSDELRRKSFLGKISRREVGVLAGIVGLVPIYNVLYRFISTVPLFPAYFGVLSSVVLNIVGTSVGIAVVGRSTSGAAVKTPSIFLKGVLGIVICEANIIFSFLCFFILSTQIATMNAEMKGAITAKEIRRAWTIFASGLSCGATGMIASLGSSIVNAAASVSIAENPKLFSQLIALQLIVGSVGVIGLVISFLFLRIPA